MSYNLDLNSYSNHTQQRSYRTGLGGASLRSLLAAAVFVGGILTAQAQFVWTGTEDNLWSNAGNWSTGAAPGTSGRAIFGAGGAYSIIDLGTQNRTIGRLEYTSGAVARSIIGNQLTLQGVGGIGLIKNDAGWQTIDAQVHMGNAQQWQINAGVLELNGDLSTSHYAQLNKSGDGMLILNGTNTSGTVWNISGGVVRVGHSQGLGSRTWGNVVANGASLELINSVNVVQDGITLSGSGYQGQGALRNVSGNNTLAAQLTLAGTTRFRSDAGMLTLDGERLSVGNHALILDGAGDVTFDTTIQGGGSVTLDGAGTVYFIGNAANNYSGMTTVNSGTLVLGKQDNTHAIAGYLTINGGVVRLEAHHQTKADKDSVITVKGPGVLDLNDHNTNIHQLVMEEGLVTTGSGVLTINNSGSSSIVSKASETASVIEGHLAFVNNGNIPFIHVDNGSAEVDLDIRATLSSTNGFDKKGAGTLRLNQTVTTGGTTIWNHPMRISEGTLLLGNSNIIDDTAAVVLNGGRLATGGHSDVMGTLTLTANSVLDVGHGESKIHFADSRNQQWSSGKTLYVDNWSGSTSGGGIDQIVFGSDSNALSATQLGQIIFRDPNGMPPGYYGAMMLANGEIVPVPEPAAIIAIGGLIGLICWRERRRIQVGVRSIRALLAK